jgi:hypothetical protein
MASQIRFNLPHLSHPLGMKLELAGIENSLDQDMLSEK